jgi:hypothetical protein
MYLVVKNGNDTRSYSCKTTHDGTPFMRVSSGYLDLTTQTLNGLKVKVKNGNSTYRAKWLHTTQGTNYSTETETTGYSGYSSVQNYRYKASGYRRTTNSYSTYSGYKSTKSNSSSTSSSTVYGYDYNNNNGSVGVTGNGWWENTQATNYYESETRAYTKKYDHVSTSKDGSGNKKYVMKDWYTYKTTKRTSSLSTKEVVTPVQGSFSTTSNTTLYQARGSTTYDISVLYSSTTLTGQYATTDCTPYYADFTSTSRQISYYTNYYAFTDTISSNMVTTGGYNTTALTKTEQVESTYNTTIEE